MAMIYFNVAIVTRATSQLPWPKPLGCHQRAPSQVDAKVFYAEAGLEIRGEWRTADGSTGSVTGTKALAGLALGGVGVTCGLVGEPGRFHGETWEKPGQSWGKHREKRGKNL